MLQPKFQRIYVYYGLSPEDFEIKTFPITLDAEKFISSLNREEVPYLLVQQVITLGVE